MLKVATVNSPTTYYEGVGGPTGFEYDLARGFAERLGVRLELQPAASTPAALELVRTGRAHFAAASVLITDSRRQEWRFTRPLLHVVPQVIYRAGARKPQSVDELDGQLEVVTDSGHAELLKTLSTRHPSLSWRETADFESEDLLAKVAEGEIDYTIAASDLVSINQRYYPSLRVAFDLSDAQDIAWAFPGQGDESLLQAAGQYLDALGSKELARLEDRHFGHVEQVDHLGAVALAAHASMRLPRYREAFQRAAAEFGLDWRLLAAIGYQESHWDSTAVSPTGVRGIMQLTVETADFLKVADREDPAQSIRGGARYLRQILDQLPAEIQEPDRTWLALAAYNMGLGHLFDAQRLAVERGGDPRRWLDVRESLPLLTQTRWFTRTRNGYARGYQAMHFVGNVRTYFDMLLWITGDRGAAPEVEQTVQADPPARGLHERNSRDNPLNISAPML